jgi:hypothetical protein
MPRSLIRFLIFLSTASLGLSCSQYRLLQKIQSDASCVKAFKPDLDHVVYRTSVEVVGKHLSGLLIFKKMPDSSVRIVFSNEMGLSFFDLGFGADSGFTVYQIVPQMDKKPLILTLQKDFELLLFRNMDYSKYYALAGNGLVYHAFPQSKGVNYYLTDSVCRQLVKMQRASDKKPVMEVRLFGTAPGLAPDSISIQHLNFNFSISLKKISALAPQ